MNVRRTRDYGERPRHEFWRTCFAAATTSLVLAVGCPILFGQQPNADEIVRRSDEAVRGRTEEGSVSMTVKTADWERTLELRYWAVNPTKTFIRVIAPAKEAGTGTLRLGTNMWNYLPSVEQTIKIPPSLMLESWMGDRKSVV